MKQVQKTAEIIERLKAAFGAEVDPNAYAVFEAIALNQRPIRQKHPLFEGAVAQTSLLRELVANIKGESAPLQLQHKGGALPSGRVFDAQLVNDEVRILFAMTNTADNASLIADLDAGIIDQVSVNILAKQLLCSHAGCGFDYLGPDADYMNILNAECGEGHKLREDGTHIEMHGIDSVFEISLVGTGGADGARIVGRDNQAFASESFQRLAASGLAPAMLVASLSATPNPKDETLMPGQNIDINALIAASATDKAEITTLTASNAALTTQVATLTAERDAAVAAQAAAETERDAALETAAPDQAVLDLVAAAAKAALVAGGDNNPTVPEKVEDQIKVIKDAGLVLSMIPAGGRANTNPSDLETEKDTPAANSAFRRAK